MSEFGIRAVGTIPIMDPAVNSPPFFAKPGGLMPSLKTTSRRVRPLYQKVDLGDLLFMQETFNCMRIALSPYVTPTLHVSYSLSDFS